MSGEDDVEVMELCASSRVRSNWERLRAAGYDLTVF